MPFPSIWEYIRERSRDAVLAGFQDAMDIVENGDTNGSQHGAAGKLTSRFGQAEPKQLTEAPAGDGPQEAPGAAETRRETANGEMPDEFDAELERRLQDAAPTVTRAAANEPPSASTKRATAAKDAPKETPSNGTLHKPNGQPLRKRGRPRKDETR
jgi:hypothetical protein